MGWKQWLERLGAASRAVDENRWVMLDVETSGLDPHVDRLLAIAAIGLKVDWSQQSIRIDVADSFEVDLRQELTSSKDNILLHGIGAQRQQLGMAPERALGGLADYVGQSPMLAFHANFDQAMIDRACRKHLGSALPNSWVDLADLCAVTYDTVGARSLDQWLDYFNLSCAVRHQAAADTLAQCELLLRIWPRMVQQCQSWRQVQRLAAQRSWLVYGRDR